MADGTRPRFQTQTHLHDLPDVILSNLFTLITDIRSRNSMSLVCHKWRLLDRLTRTSLTLRGNVRDLAYIPQTCFRAVTHLDLSLLSPWGHPILDSSIDPPSLARYLRDAFPLVTSLTLYSRDHETLDLLASQWPSLSHVKLVRWHQRPPAPLGSDFVSLFKHCSSLSSLDLSHFYFWTEDLPPALQAFPSVAASLSRLDLLTLSSAGGFKAQELLAISAACPNLSELLVACVFDSRYFDFVGDAALLGVASNCPRLSVLHLADASSLSNVRGDPDNEGFTSQDARISCATLQDVFSGLPLLEELALDACQNVRDCGPALEMLNSKCPRLRSLKLGQFHGICKAIGSQLDGIALCKNLESLSIKNSADLNDSALLAISRGCPRLTQFEVQGCKNITGEGMRNFAGMLRRTLVDVKISCCKNFDAAASLQALEPIRNRIERLHIDCVWDGLKDSQRVIHEFDLNAFEEEDADCNAPDNKKCRYGDSFLFQNNGNGFGSGTWDRLRYLSLWIAVGELLTPLALVGLRNCPLLEEIRIKIEGDCRGRPKPSPAAFGLSSLEVAFGLSSLVQYPSLWKMQLDCGDAIGYALTAPSGHTDLSLWERFYLNGIGNLRLNELDYWPPQDMEVNQRSLSLPAAGLLAECADLRKLFIHGTTHEHFMMFLLRIRNLRDVQLREDYYPAPENDMSTEMRVDSCSRFEDALNRRIIPY